MTQSGALPYELMPRNPNQRAFAMQYTSVVLLILSFIVGAYAGARKGDSPAAQAPVQTVSQVPAMPPAPQNPAFSALQFEHVNSPDGLLLVEKFDGLRQVLLDHDVDARVDLLASDEADLVTALERSRDLTDYFAAAGVPDGALSVYVREHSATDAAARDSARARIRFEEEAHGRPQ